MVGSLTRHPLCSFEVTWLPTRKETSRLKQLGKLYLLSILSRAELRFHNHAPNDHTESNVTRSQMCDNNETYDLAYPTRAAHAVQTPLTLKYSQNVLPNDKLLTYQAALAYPSRSFRPGMCYGQVQLGTWNLLTSGLPALVRVWLAVTRAD